MGWLQSQPDALRQGIGIAAVALWLALLAVLAVALLNAGARAASGPASWCTSAGGR